MCMIIYKPAGENFPDLGILNQVLARNHDGTGILCKGNVKKFSCECYPEILDGYSKSDALMIHSRFATRGSVNIDNVHPFCDKRLPGYWFAHNGTMAYSPAEDMTDSEWFYHNILVPEIQKIGLPQIFSMKHNMRVSGSRFILWSGRNEDLPYLFGRWHYLDGCFYSSFVFGAVDVGKYDGWWTPIDIEIQRPKRKRDYHVVKTPTVWRVGTNNKIHQAHVTL